ncbi:MAG: alpha-ribazole phosphatase family protein [Amaricoccus sp.]
MALILLRHGRPAGAADRCYGRTDLLTGPHLLCEAQSIAAALAPVDRIVSSPLRRCRRLAALLGARLGVPVRFDPAWREIDFGAWEGLAWDAVPRAQLDAWAADFLHARPHGGESVAMLLARVRGALARARRVPGRVLAVTHAGPIRAALFATGAGPTAWQRNVGFGELVEIGGRR